MRHIILAISKVPFDLNEIKLSFICINFLIPEYYPKPKEYIDLLVSLLYTSIHPLLHPNRMY
jgi:hypothetical protein